jgi:hypothetical protein
MCCYCYSLCTGEQHHESESMQLLLLCVTATQVCALSLSLLSTAAVSVRISCCRLLVPLTHARTTAIEQSSAALSLIYAQIVDDVVSYYG